MGKEDTQSIGLPLMSRWLSFFMSSLYQTLYHTSRLPYVAVVLLKLELCGSKITPNTAITIQSIKPIKIILNVAQFFLQLFFLNPN